MIVAPVFCRRFIGRTAELALMSERLQHATAGAGSLVLVSGDAGIGKTRFVEAVRAALEAPGVRFAVGNCWRHGGSPLDPIAQVVRALHDADPSVLVTAAALRPAIARIVPELDAGDAASFGDDARAHYAAIGETLRRFGEASPAIVVVEDAHWSDRATLEFLEYAAEHISRWPIVLVVTYRTDELRLDHPLAIALSKLGRHGAWRLALQPLSETEMAQFARAALAGRDNVAAERIAEALAIAGGNPLFAEELLRECADRGVVELPLSVRAAVLERAATLSSDDRAVLAYAAVIGVRFDVTMLAELTGRSAEAIAGVLRTARNLQLVVPFDVANDVYAFRHAVIQEALYEELLPSETRSLHARIAMRLEAAASDDAAVTELAHHWHAAGDAAKSVTYNEAAGDLAARRLAHHDAVRFYERALACVERESQPEALLYEKLGRALTSADPGRRALRALEVALRWFERSGARERAVDVLMSIARQYFHVSDADGYRRSVERALDIAGSDANLRLTGLTMMLGCYALGGDPDRAVPFEREALDLVERGAEPRASLFAYRGFLEMLRGRLRDTDANMRRALELAARDPSVHILPATWLNTGAQLMALGDLDGAVAAHAAAVRLGEERFLTAAPAQARLNWAQTCIVQGRFIEARTLMDEAVAGAPGASYVRLHLGYLAAMLGTLMGDRALADAFASDELVELAFRSGQPQRIEATCVAYAEAAIARGDRDEGIALLRRGAQAVGSVHQHFSLPIAVARRGVREQIPRMRGLLARWATPGDNPLGEAQLALFDAFVARTPPEARRHGDEAARRFAAIGARLFEAMAFEAAGRLDDAFARYCEIGDVLDATRLERHVVPRNRVGRAAHELTRREREIAEHVARGRSNRAIADALVLSERTVETHVASILAKLRVASRSEVAHALDPASGTRAARTGDSP